MRETTPWRQASEGVYERLYRGDLWSLRYRMGRGVWERQGPFPNRLLWVDAATGLGAAQRVTDDLISRFYGATVDHSVTDLIPRGMDHMSARGMVRSVHTQLVKAQEMVEQRSSPHDREAWEMREALAVAASLLARWGSPEG